MVVIVCAIYCTYDQIRPAGVLLNFLLFILKVGTGTTFLETRRCAAATMATAYLTNDPIW